MARLFLLLLGLCSVASPLLAQPPAQPASPPSSSSTAQASTAPRSELVLLFVRSDAADALQASAVMRNPDWTVFKETGPLVGKTGPVLYALFPRESNMLAATAAADVIKDANPYLAQRGANRLELEQVAGLAASSASTAGTQAASAAPAAGAAAAAAGEPSSESIAQGDWQFTGERGLLMLFVKAGKEAQFKAVLDTLRSTLEKSPDERRRAQARGWRVLKVAGNGPSGTIVYVSVLDPVVHGVNYAPSSVFSEALDGEALVKAYTEYADALSSFNLIDLEQVRP